MDVDAVHRDVGNELSGDAGHLANEQKDRALVDVVGQDCQGRG